MSGPTYAVMAHSYPSMAAAGRAFESIDSGPRRGYRTSLYRAKLDGAVLVVLLIWEPTTEHVADAAQLPWGDGEPVFLPPQVADQFAQRSVVAAPAGADLTRRICRGPTGRVLSDRTRRRAVGWSEPVKAGKLQAPTD